MLFICIQPTRVPKDLRRAAGRRSYILDLHFLFNNVFYIAKYDKVTVITEDITYGKVVGNAKIGTDLPKRLYRPSAGIILGGYAA